MGTNSTKPQNNDITALLENLDPKKISAVTYDEIRKNPKHFQNEFQKNFNKSSTENEEKLKFMSNIIEQCITDEQLESEPKRGQPVQEKDITNPPSRCISNTRILALTGNIFGMKELYEEEEPLLIVPGNVRIRDLPKLGFSSVQGELFRVSDFLKFDHPKSFIHGHNYYYKDVKIIKRPDKDGNYEPAMKNIHVLYTVSIEIQSLGDQKQMESYEKMLRGIFKRAYNMNYQSIFIPPLGCGWKNNSISHVAEIFKVVLKDFEKSFKNIYIFSINMEHVNEFKKLPNFLTDDGDTQKLMPIIQNKIKEDEDPTLTKKPAKCINNRENFNDSRSTLDSRKESNNLPEDNPNENNATRRSIFRTLEDIDIFTSEAIPPVLK